MSRHQQFGSVAIVDRFDCVGGTPPSGTIGLAARETTKMITVQVLLMPRFWRGAP